MIHSTSFTQDHLGSIRTDFPVDNSILERTIFALALLEALARVGLPFIFKGGTSLLLLLDTSRRLSTDIKWRCTINPFISIVDLSHTHITDIQQARFSHLLRLLGIRYRRSALNLPRPSCKECAEEGEEDDEHFKQQE